MAITANSFVEGVKYAASIRSNSEWANFSLLGETYSYASVVFLLAAAGSGRDSEKVSRAARLGWTRRYDLCGP
jgi:hypothetical protein